MKKGFQKLELIRKTSEDKNIPVLTSTAKNKNNKQIIFIGKIMAVFLCLILLTGIIFALIIALPTKEIYSSFQKTSIVAKEAYGAVKNQDIEAAKVKFKELDDNLQIVDKNVGKIAWTTNLPFVGVYTKDLKHLVTAGINGVQAGEIAIETILPYSDLLGLKGKSTFVSGSADERIKMAIETFEKIIPNIDKISEKISIVDKELEQVDANRYPEKIGNTVIRSRFQLAKDLFLETSSLFVNAQPLLKKVPDLMGLKEAKRYIVFFQNDAELRATGGFLTGYALFKIEKGKIQVEKSDDIYKLDEAKKKKFPVPTPIAKYHKGVYNWELRDSNLSPDYVVSMMQFEKMLGESVTDFPSYHGIIALDTHVLVSAIEILGEFNIGGRKFSAEIDKRCDCPKAIYELEDYSTRPVAYVREDRKDIIGILLYQVMQRALGVSPGKYWGKLSQMFLEEARQKHILFYFHDPEAQKGIEAINFAGRLISVEGDYLHVNNVNFAGAKSNMFVKTGVKQEIEVEGDGSIVETVTISYKNPSPPSNCNLEAGQLCLNGILRNWLRVYVPDGSTLIDFKGSEKDTVTYQESGKTVFEGFLTVKPQGASEVKIKYRLPTKYKKGESHKLYVQKQAGTDANEYSLIYKGKQIDKSTLITDKEIAFKM